tara:strand:+ start:991 stop:2070 length:1080 start_codon:yes stop_codon:yes gene_type:complete
MRNELSMIDIENPGGIAGLGRGEDTMLAHVAPGEMVVPPVLSPETQETIKKEMMAVGLDPNQYTVGDGMSINPITGMAEFGFLKKLGKSLKKVVKKVAPVAAIGLGIAGIGGVGPLGGLLGKGASSATSGKFFGAKGKFRSGLAGLFGRTPSTTTTTTPSSTSKSTGPFGGQILPNLQNRFGSGRFFGLKTPSIIKKVEDAVKGEGDGSGINLPLLALAGLYGEAVKEDFEGKQGGLKDIRQSIRPDLMPAPTFTGFDVGIRPGMSYGGRIDEQELDLRMGGPSIGPGTGTSDDIPAMLSDGEFVMTSSANNGLGGFKITKTETGIELIPNGAPDRQKGAKNMDKLMKTFEKFNEIGKV